MRYYSEAQDKDPLFFHLFMLVMEVLDCLLEKVRVGGF